MALKLKTVRFEVKTRAVTLPHPVSSADQLFSAASDLLTAEIRACAPNLLRLRLMGESNCRRLCMAKFDVCVSTGVRISSLQKKEEEDGKARTRGTPKQETLDVFMHQHPAFYPTTQDCGDDSTKQEVVCQTNTILCLHTSLLRCVSTRWTQVYILYSAPYVALCWKRQRTMGLSTHTLTNVSTTRPLPASPTVDPPHQALRKYMPSPPKVLLKL